MIDRATQEKWDSAAASYDIMRGFGPERRWREAKTRLFSGMEGQILFVAVGTGLDIPCFPPGKQIVGIDISVRMLEKARHRAEAYSGSLILKQMDVHELEYADASFDQVYSSCTFCSVPDPVRGLKSLRRVLKPGGKLGMFEHTGSRLFPFSLMLHTMNPIARLFGPEMDRDTVANVRAAGFEIDKVTNIYLDVVKTIEARRPHGDPVHGHRLPESRARTAAAIGTSASSGKG